MGGRGSKSGGKGAGRGAGGGSPAAPSPAPLGPIESAEAKFNGILEDVKFWRAPDYDRARSEVADIFAPLTAFQAKQVAGSFLFDSGSRGSKNAIVKAAQAIVLRRLENRLMFMDSLPL
jgi:hypothetical protein